MGDLVQKRKAAMPDYDFVVLISASMPSAALRALFEQAAAYGPERVRFVIRGFEPKQIGRTIAHFRQYFTDPNKDQVIIDVDPTIFRHVDAQAVPVFLVKQGENWFETRGEISLAGALENVKRKGPLVVGQLHPIKEPDMLALIESRVAGLDWDRIERRLQQKALRGQVKGEVFLPRSTETKTTLVTPAVPILEDIVLQDASGSSRVVARAGDTVNPLKTRKLDRTVIVIDTADRAQLDFLKQKVQMIGRDRVDVFFTGEAFLNELVAELQLPLYPLYPWMAYGMQVAATPAIIEQQGDQLRISYFNLQTPTAQK